jgi:hypothetical protein
LAVPERDRCQHPADLIARVKREHEAGASMRAIARRLSAEGIPTVRGGAWHAATVAYMLRQ